MSDLFKTSPNTSSHSMRLHEKGDSMVNLDLWVVKLIAAGILFVLSLSAGLSPLFCLRRYIVNPSAGRAKAALGFASCIAAGVFLAVCLLDLLPDVQEALTSGLSQLEIKIAFPLAELVMAIGLFFILTVELTVSMLSPDFTEMMHSHGGGEGHGHSHGGGHSHDHDHSHHHDHHEGHSHQHSNTNHRIRYEEIAGNLATNDDSDSDLTGRNLGAGKHKSQSTNRQPQRRRHHSSECERTALLSSSPPVLDAGATDSVSIHSQGSGLVRSSSVQSLPPIHLESGKTLREEVFDAGLSTFDKPFRAIILLIALSIHSLFEGLSIGAAQNNDIVLQLTLALAIHKPLESLGVCLSLIRSAKTQGFVVKMVILFSITCPLGVGIGIGILGFLTSGVSDLVTGILQGLAGGSFLYVVFIEVLPHEFVEVMESPVGPDGSRPVTPSQRRDAAKRIRTLKLFKVLGLLLGFTLITITKLFLPEGDEKQRPC